MPKLRADYSERIASALRKRGWDQYDLSNRTNIPAERIEQMVTGAYRPNADVGRLVERELDVDLYHGENAAAEVLATMLASSVAHQAEADDGTVLAELWPSQYGIAQTVAANTSGSWTARRVQGPSSERSGRAIYRFERP